MDPGERVQPSVTLIWDKSKIQIKKPIGQETYSRWESEQILDHDLWEQAAGGGAAQERQKGEGLGEIVRIKFYKLTKPQGMMAYK